jgi:hypothetical protein
MKGIAMKAFQAKARPKSLFTPILSCHKYMLEILKEDEIDFTGRRLLP